MRSKLYLQIKVIDLNQRLKDPMQQGIFNMIPNMVLKEMIRKNQNHQIENKKINKHNQTCHV